jgi:hypothetical protein
MGNREMEKIVERSGFFAMDGKIPSPVEGKGLTERFGCYRDSPASFTAERVTPIMMKKANRTLG